MRPEVLPFLGVTFLVSLLLALLCGRYTRLSWRKAWAVGALCMAILGGYMLWFFRDPDRTPPQDPAAIVAAADGVIAHIAHVREDKYLHADTVRISIFLSLFDVHVNRAPISGTSTFKGYHPGKRFFTFEEKSSEFNQHNTILIAGAGTRCLMKQIVGPVCRRVVYWLDPEHGVNVSAGERIGMMKFGSRLDMYFPASDITVLGHEGERVRAGETVIARIKEPGE